MCILPHPDLFVKEKINPTAVFIKVVDFTAQSVQSYWLAYANLHWQEIVSESRAAEFRSSTLLPAAAFVLLPGLPE